MAEDIGALLQGLGEGYLKGRQIKIQQEELNLKKKKQDSELNDLIMQMTVVGAPEIPGVPERTYTPRTVESFKTLQPGIRPSSDKKEFNPFEPVTSLSDYRAPSAPVAPSMLIRPGYTPPKQIGTPGVLPAPGKITIPATSAIPAVPERQLTSEERLAIKNITQRSKTGELPAALPTGEKLGLGPKQEEAGKMIHLPDEVRKLIKDSYEIDLPSDIPQGISGIISSALSSKERRDRSGLALKKYRDQEEQYKTGLRAKARSQAIREMYENDYFYGQESTKDDTIIDKVSERANAILIEWKTGKPAKKETAMPGTEQGDAKAIEWLKNNNAPQTPANIAAVRKKFGW